MKRVLCLTMIVVLLFSPTVAASKLPEELISDSLALLDEIATQPDAEQFYRFLGKSKGLAIFPSVIKAGLGLGGRYGDGFILRYDPENKSWYGPYFVNLKGISYGFQVGIQSTALLLVINSKDALESLQAGKITLGGSMSVATGPLGRSAEAGTDLKLEAPFYSYSLSKGAFIGASFEGSSITNNESTNQLYWQQALEPKDIFTKLASKVMIRDLINKLNLIVQ